VGLWRQHEGNLSLLPRGGEESAWYLKAKPRRSIKKGKKIESSKSSGKERGCMDLLTRGRQQEGDQQVAIRDGTPGLKKKGGYL